MFPIHLLSICRLLTGSHFCFEAAFSEWTTSVVLSIQKDSVSSMYFVVNRLKRGLSGSLFFILICTANEINHIVQNGLRLCFCKFRNYHQPLCPHTRRSVRGKSKRVVMSGWASIKMYTWTHPFDDGLIWWTTEGQPANLYVYYIDSGSIFWHFYSIRSLIEISTRSIYQIRFTIRKN